MLLRKRPTYFVKGEDRRKAFYTVQARELISRGYVEEGAEVNTVASKPDKTPEIPVIAGEDAYETVSNVVDELDQVVSIDYKTYKKAELLSMAEDLGIEVDSSWLKADLVAALEGTNNG